MSYIDPSRSRLLGQKLRQHREAGGLTVEELARLAEVAPRRIQDLEDELVGSCPPDRHCAWGDEATAELERLCRTADRVDILAPLGLPAWDGLDTGRCTAYILEGDPIARADVTTRVVPHSAGAYPGIERPVTLFRMPDGSSVVFYAYLHEAFFTEDPRETEAARAIFGRLHDCSIAATA